MRKPIAIVALAISLAFTVSSCAGDSKPISQKDLQKQLEDVGKLKPKFAACVAEEIYPKLSTDDKKSLNNKAQASVKDENKVYKLAKTAGAACVAKGVTPTS